LAERAKGEDSIAPLARLPHVMFWWRRGDQTWRRGHRLHRCGRRARRQT
jgi:hypothetical protein